MSKKCVVCYCYKPLCDFYNAKKDINLKCCVRCRTRKNKPLTEEQKAKNREYFKIYYCNNYTYLNLKGLKYREMRAARENREYKITENKKIEMEEFPKCVKCKNYKNRELFIMENGLKMCNMCDYCREYNRAANMLKMWCIKALSTV